MASSDTAAAVLALAITIEKRLGPDTGKQAETRVERRFQRARADMVSADGA